MEKEENEPREQAIIAILISNKIDFKPKLIKRGSDEYKILIKGGGDIVIFNISALNTRTPKFINEIFSYL